MKKTLPIRESRKIEKQYAKALLVRAAWLEDHQDQIINALKRNEERYQGDAPAQDLISLLNNLKAMFLKRFPFAMTSRLAKAVFKRVDSHNIQRMEGSFNAIGVNLKDILKRDNLTDFTSIAVQNNVDLIKSIDEEYFSKVEKIVLNGMQNGEDFDIVGKKIREATGATKKRARFIARDQVSTINAQLSKRRAEKAGITKGIWIKTKSSKTKNYTPRKSHIAADGKVFDLAKGLKVDGEYIIPGGAINCTCTMAFVVE